MIVTFNNNDYKEITYETKLRLFRCYDVLSLII